MPQLLVLLPIPSTPLHLVMSADARGIALAVDEITQVGVGNYVVVHLQQMLKVYNNSRG